MGVAIETAAASASTATVVVTVASYSAASHEQGSGVEARDGRQREMNRDEEQTMITVTSRILADQALLHYQCKTAAAAAKKKKKVFGLVVHSQLPPN